MCIRIMARNGHQRALNQPNKCVFAYFICGTALTYPLDDSHRGNIWIARIPQLCMDFWDTFYTLHLVSLEIIISHPRLDLVTPWRRLLLPPPPDSVCAFDARLRYGEKYHLRQQSNTTRTFKIENDLSSPSNFSRSLLSAFTFSVHQVLT